MFSRPVCSQKLQAHIRLPAQGPGEARREATAATVGPGWGRGGDRLGGDLDLEKEKEG